MGIPEIWTKAWNALSNKEDEGFSVTKSIAALFATFCVVIASIYTNALNLEIVLGLFFSAIFTLLVKKSVERYKTKKINKNETPKDNENI